MVVEDGREEQETDNAVGPIQAALLAFDAAQTEKASVHSSSGSDDDDHQHLLENMSEENRSLAKYVAQSRRNLLSPTSKVRSDK